MSTTLFEVNFTRKHLARKRAKADRLHVLGRSPVDAARFLLRTLKRGSAQGVFSLVSVAPVVPTDEFSNHILRARRKLRKGDVAGEQREIFRAVARGARG